MEIKRNLSESMRIFTAAVAANFSAIVMLFCIGCTTPVLPKLKADNINDSPVNYKINATEESWISSLLPLGGLLGPFLAGPLADRIGRKWSLMSSSVFFVGAFILAIIANKVCFLMLARFVQGIGVGFVVTIQPMYIAEISTDNMRGVVGSFMQLFTVFGILYVYAIGPYVSYITLQWFCIAMPLVFNIVFFLMPESPYYYARKGFEADAIKSLQFLRSCNLSVIENELISIKHALEEAATKKGTLAEIFINKGNRMALFISVGLLAFQQFCGINAVLFNTQSIFDIADTHLAPAMASIIVGIMLVAASAVTPVLVDRLGRKQILLISAGMMGTVLIALGIFFFQNRMIANIAYLSWLPLPAMVVYITAYCIGFGPLPWVILGELFPNNIKAIASSLAASSCWLFSFMVTYLYPSINSLGIYYAFWLFAAFCIVAFIFTFLFVIETKGLSLQQIQTILNMKSTNANIN